MKDAQSLVVLLSGGQDSCIALYWAMREFMGPKYNRLAVSFAYGQRHRAELEASERLAARVGWSRVIVPLTEALSWSRSALINYQAELTQGNGENLPSSFVPGRNAIFLAIAAGLGYEMSPGAIHIVTGVCQTDFSGYPDCRREFIDAQEKALTLALDRSVAIITPLMDMTKAEEVDLAQKLPGCMEALAQTVTCYNGERPGCGTCPACKLRAKGFGEAGVRDPASW